MGPHKNPKTVFSKTILLLSPFIAACVLVVEHISALEVVAWYVCVCMCAYVVACVSVRVCVSERGNVCEFGKEYTIRNSSGPRIKGQHRKLRMGAATVWDEDNSSDSYP